MVSNKKFGFSFSFIFLLFSIYSYFNHYSLFFIFLIFALLMFVLSLFKPNYLQTFNRLWYNFGIFLGKFFNPIFLGILFFLVFSPLSILLRLLNRDELKLKNKKENSYWDVSSDKNDFRNQF